ncbi:hypothetical protein EMIT0210MI2_11206 [Priestia megaterium]
MIRELIENNKVRKSIPLRTLLSDIKSITLNVHLYLKSLYKRSLKTTHFYEHFW